MKEYKSGDIRNLAIVGHGACGKTILSEAMLANGGIVNRIGSIENGSTVSDYHPDEHEPSNIYACNSIASLNGMIRKLILLILQDILIL